METFWAPFPSAPLAIFSIAVVASIVIPGIAVAQSSAVPLDLSGKSIEELMNIQISSVSRKDQTLSKVASAIYVLDSESIRRSGATNIPDLLRIVPGVEVAQIDAHTWGISVRGFNERFTRNVLVLIDGRTIYSPSYGGVDWDQQNVPLEDIERIEVIRGPGGTVWGVNAVNGVINIITKKASMTKGGLVRAGGGSQQVASTLLQFGSSAGARGDYRIFGDYANDGNSPGSNNNRAADGSHTLHGGFRSDWTLSPHDSLTIQGDIAEIGAGQTIGNLLSTNLLVDGVYNDAVSVGAANILGHWNRVLSSGSETSLQVSYDRTNRVDTGVRERRQTIDIDFHDHLKWRSRNDIVWGLGYRFTRENITNDSTAATAGNVLTFTPPQLSDNLFSAFIQDEFRLTNTLFLTAGSKFEHNEFTGFEYEPSVQVVWQPTDRQEVWISLARAVRQPTRTDEGVHVNFPTVLPNGIPALVTLTGDQNAQVARLRDVEIGYRAQISKRISVDFATFLSYYNGLPTIEPLTPSFSITPSPHFVIPEELEQLSHARSYGGEIFATWNVNSRWKISPGYSLIHLKLDLDPTSHDPDTGGLGGGTPEHQFQFRSLLNLTSKTDFDSCLFYVSTLRGAGTTPSYTRLDMRLARRVGDSIEISIVGQNLLSARHPEFFDSQGLVHTLVRRTVFGKVTWTF